MTEDVERWWSDRTGTNLTPFFDEYLRHAALPALELRFDPAQHTMSYRWKADEPGFAIPINVGDPQQWTRVTPNTSTWQSMPWTGKPEDFHVDIDHFYVDVGRTDTVLSASTAGIFR
jgi:hypothetical protein